MKRLIGLFFALYLFNSIYANITVVKQQTIKCKKYLSKFAISQFSKGKAGASFAFDKGSIYYCIPYDTTSIKRQNILVAGKDYKYLLSNGEKTIKLKDDYTYGGQKSLGSFQLANDKLYLLDYITGRINIYTTNLQFLGYIDSDNIKFSGEIKIIQDNILYSFGENFFNQDYKSCVLANLVLKDSTYNVYTTEDLRTFSDKTELHNKICPNPLAIMKEYGIDENMMTTGAFESVFTSSLYAHSVFCINAGTFYTMDCWGEYIEAYDDSLHLKERIAIPLMQKFRKTGTPTVINNKTKLNTRFSSILRLFYNKQKDIFYVLVSFDDTDKGFFNTKIGMISVPHMNPDNNVIIPLEDIVYDYNPLDDIFYQCHFDNGNYIINETKIDTAGN